MNMFGANGTTETKSVRNISCTSGCEMECKWVRRDEAIHITSHRPYNVADQAKQTIHHSHLVKRDG